MIITAIATGRVGMAAGGRRYSTAATPSPSARAGAVRTVGHARPEPGGGLRDAVELTSDARLDIPSTLICTGYSSQQYKEAMDEGYAWLAGLKEVRNNTWVHLPTSHWPMWSRPKELAEIIGDVAKAHASGD